MRNKTVKLAGLIWMVVMGSYINAGIAEKVTLPSGYEVMVYEEEEAPVLTGARAALSQSAVRIYEGDKVKKTIYVKDNEEGARLIKELKQKGLQDREEIKVEGLSNPSRRRFDDGKLRFIDKSEKVFKETDLNAEFRIEDDLDKSGKPVRIKRQIVKYAKVSDNGKYAVIRYFIYNIARIEDNGNEISFQGEGGGYGEMKLFNEKGKILFDGKISGELLAISNQGDIAILEGSEMEPIPYVVRVYNKSGEEIYHLSHKDVSGHLMRGYMSVFSPSGRYFSIERSVTRKDNASPFIFVDLKNKKWWSPAPRAIPLGIHKIKDNGDVIVKGSMSRTGWVYSCNLREQFEK